MSVIANGINGRTYQHSTVSARAVGVPGLDFKFRNFADLKYEDGAKKKPFNRADGKRVGYTIDKQEITASIKVLMAEWIAFSRALRNGAPGLGIGQIEWDFAIVHGNSLLTLVTDELNGVLIDKDARESSDNQDTLYVSTDLFVTEVTLDGDYFIEYGE